jgi:uncharacterized membrane protein YgdD (TMEM256/DUF423 family)
MRFWIFAAAINGLIAVGMGAMGSHALQHLGERSLTLIDLGSNYQLWHALGLVGVGLLTPYVHRARGIQILKFVGAAFTIGTVLFSGGLYVLALTGPAGPVRWIVPIGGTLMMLGWVGLSLSALFIEPQKRG